MKDKIRNMILENRETLKRTKPHIVPINTCPFDMQCECCHAIFPDLEEGFAEGACPCDLIEEDEMLSILKKYLGRLP